MSREKELRTTPASLLLIHGAGSGPWIYDDWPESFPGLRICALDLQLGLQVSSASMADYADRVIAVAHDLPQPLSLCGWSMGGLVALLAATRLTLHSLVLIEPSPPAEVQGYVEIDAHSMNGTFDPEVVYGPFPAGVPARPESSRARAERKRGISVQSVPCPSLVIYGDEYREERGRQIARLYHSREHDFPGLNHWDLVRDNSVREAIRPFLTHAT